MTSGQRIKLAGDKIQNDTT